MTVLATAQIKLTAEQEAKLSEIRKLCVPQFGEETKGGCMASVMFYMNETVLRVAVLDKFTFTDAAVAIERGWDVQPFSQSGLVPIEPTRLAAKPKRVAR